MYEDIGVNWVILLCVVVVIIYNFYVSGIFCVEYWTDRWCSLHLVYWFLVDWDRRFHTFCNSSITYWPIYTRVAKRMKPSVNQMKRAVSFYSIFNTRYTRNVAVINYNNYGVRFAHTQYFMPMSKSVIFNYRIGFTYRNTDHRFCCMHFISHEW